MNDGHAFWEMLCTCDYLQGTRVHADGTSGEINYEYFFGQLPTKKQSGYAREQNCKLVQPDTRISAKTNANMEQYSSFTSRYSYT